MTIGRNIGCSVFKRKGQQATCQTGQRCIQTFRMHLRMTNKMAEQRLSAVERTQQPEQRHVRYREVGHSLVAFPTHRHQALQARTELTRQLFGLFPQPTAGLYVKQRRQKRLVLRPVSRLSRVRRIAATVW